MPGSRLDPHTGMVIVPEYTAEGLAELMRDEFAEQQRAAAAKVERDETPANKSLVRGVEIESRHDEVHELRTLATLVQRMPDHLLGHVVSVYCNSKATHSYMIQVKLETNHETVLSIAYAFAMGCNLLNKGHNGICVSRVERYMGAEIVPASWNADFLDEVEGSAV